MGEGFHGQVEQIDANRWRIPKASRPDMRVDGIIYANDELIERRRCAAAALTQVANVATLPGIVGGVAGHAGHPLGLRLLHRRRGGDGHRRRRRDLARRRGLRHQLRRAAAADRPARPSEVRPRLKDLVDQLFRDVPVRRGRRRAVRVRRRRDAAAAGRGRAVPGWHAAWPRRRTSTPPSPAAASRAPTRTPSAHEAYQRGADQCGTLGSGQPLRRGAGRRGDLRRRRRPRRWAWRRARSPS